LLAQRSVGSDFRTRAKVLDQIEVHSLRRSQAAEAGYALGLLHRHGDRGAKLDGFSRCLVGVNDREVRSPLRPNVAHARGDLRHAGDRPCAVLESRISKLRHGHDLCLPAEHAGVKPRCAIDVRCQILEPAWRAVVTGIRVGSAERVRLPQREPGAQGIGTCGDAALIGDVERRIRMTAQGSHRLAGCVGAIDFQ
jgi:hypothetical protein